MSTKRKRDNNAVQMYEKAKSAWLEFIDEFKNNRLLWDPTDKHYTNQNLRAEAREQLLEKFRKIDDCATVVIMNKRIQNMRTTYHRERKKVLESIQKGGTVYRPTLWYFDQFSFLEPSDKDVVPNFNTIRYFRNAESGLRRQSAEESMYSSTPSVRNSERINSFKNEEEDTETQTPPPKRRIFHLLQKQEKFVDEASKTLFRKEREWEVHGKAIGLQLDKLDKTQRTIANKLIAETIYYGSLGKLTTDSYVCVEDFQRLSPDSGRIEALEESDDNSCHSKNEEIFINLESPGYNNDDN